MTRPRKTRRILIAATLAAALIGVAAFLHGQRAKPFELIRVIRNPSPLEYKDFGDILLVWEGKIFVLAYGREGHHGALLALDFESGDVLYSIQDFDDPNEYYIGNITATGDFLVFGGWDWNGCRAYLLNANTGRMIRELESPSGQSVDDTMRRSARVASNEEYIAVGYPESQEVLLFDAKTGDFFKTIEQPKEEAFFWQSDYDWNIAIEGSQLLMFDAYDSKDGSESGQAIHVYDLSTGQFRLRIQPMLTGSEGFYLQAGNGTILLRIDDRYDSYELADGKLRFAVTDPLVDLKWSGSGDSLLWMEDKLIQSDTWVKNSDGRLYWIHAPTGEILRYIECPLPSGYTGPLNTFNRGEWIGGHRFGSTLARNGDDLLVGAPGFANGEGAIFVLRGPETTSVKAKSIQTK